MDLIALNIFLVVRKERNLRAFEGVEDIFYRVRDRWFQTLGILVLAYPLDNFREPINILIDL